MKLATLLSHAIKLHGGYAMVYECTYTTQRKAVVYCKYKGVLLGYCTFEGRKPIYTELI